MAEDRIVKFCVRVGPRNVMRNCPPGGRGYRSRDVLIFGQLSVNISKTVQNRDTLTMED